VYDVLLRDGTLIGVDNPSRMPDPAKIAEIREPIVAVTVFVPKEYVGAVITLCTNKRGVQTNLSYHARHDAPELRAAAGRDRARLLRPPEVGVARIRLDGLRAAREPAADVAKVDLLINGDRRRRLVGDRAPLQRGPARARAGVQDEGADSAPDVRRRDPGRDRLDHHRPGKHQGPKEERAGQVLRWRDITRKRKLLEKQKAGKKRMKQVGSVEIPQEAFLAILQVED